MIINREYIVGPNIRTGFEHLVTTYGFAITYVLPDKYSHGRDTKYILEGADEDDFEKFEAEIEFLYPSITKNAIFPTV